MLQRISSFLLYKVMGFSVEITTPLPDKCIIALAPHTSNWDFIVGNLYSAAEGVKCNFMMKKEWFFWPLGFFMRHIGGIPVYRNRRTKATDSIAEQAINADKFCLCITPEGTRKANPDWKKGFYYIALKANLPILLYGLDYEKKRIVCDKVFYPTGDIEREMKEIKEYFLQFKGKHPKKFAI